MAETLIEGEPLELIQEAFRGMRARRAASGCVSLTGRLDPVPGEALLRALRRAEAHLPRQIHSTREQHRAAALDEIARQFTSAVERVPEPEEPRTSDPKLRAQSEMIPAMPIDDRVRQIEAEANFFASVRLLHGRADAVPTNPKHPTRATRSSS